MFDYKADLMKVACERERVFVLKTFDEKRKAFEEYRRLNPLPTIKKLAEDERFETVEEEDSEIETVRDAQSVGKKS
jgi:hypothetical protein